MINLSLFKDIIKAKPNVKFNSFNYFKLGWVDAFSWKNIAVNILLPFILIFFVVGFKYILLYLSYAINKPINVDSALSMLLNYIFYGHIIFLLVLVAYKQINNEIRIFYSFYKNFFKVILWEIPLIAVFLFYQIYFNLNEQAINQLLTGGSFFKLTFFLTVPLMVLYVYTLFSLFYFIFLSEKANYHLKTKNGVITFLLSLNIAFKNKKHIMFLILMNTFLSFILFIPFPVYFMFKIFFENSHMTLEQNFIVLALTIIFTAVGMLFPIMAALRGLIFNFKDFQKSQTGNRNKLTVGTSYGEHTVLWQEPTS